VRTVRLALIVVIAAAAVVTAQSWQETFAVTAKDLSPTGEGRYFILKPGYQLTFETKGPKPDTLVITVMNETKVVGGIEARVVEERETDKGELIEVSRNYFAINPKTSDVYYLGEDVDVYKKGKVVNHEGSWQYGANGATLGLMMPGKPVVGAKFYQEMARGVAMDRAEIVSIAEKLTTKAGAFANCVKTKETSPLEPLAREYKLYAPGVGLIKDGDFELVSYGSAPYAHQAPYAQYAP
jgi:hypothetical protein